MLAQTQVLVEVESSVPFESERCDRMMQTVLAVARPGTDGLVRSEPDAVASVVVSSADDEPAVSVAEPSVLAVDRESVAFASAGVEPFDTASVGSNAAERPVPEQHGTGRLDTEQPVPLRHVVRVCTDVAAESPEVGTVVVDVVVSRCVRSRQQLRAARQQMSPCVAMAATFPSPCS